MTDEAEEKTGAWLQEEYADELRELADKIKSQVEGLLFARGDAFRSRLQRLSNEAKSLSEAIEEIALELETRAEALREEEEET